MLFGSPRFARRGFAQALEEMFPYRIMKYVNELNLAPFLAWIYNHSIIAYPILFCFCRYSIILDGDETIKAPASPPFVRSHHNIQFYYY